MLGEKTRDPSLHAFLFATALVILVYLPLLFPLLDGKLAFTYADFTTFTGYESAKTRNMYTYYTFVDGFQVEAFNRAFLMEGISLFSEILKLSDSQTQSILILACLLLGSFGIYRLTGTFLREEDRPAAVLFLVPFYFLNMWSIDRIIHIWIWFTYAIFPLFVSIGLSYISERKPSLLVSYSLMFGFFGMIPHSFIYLFLVHLFLAFFCLLSWKNLKNTLVFAFFPLLIYILLNLPPLSLFLSAKVAYPVTVTMFSLEFLSEHGELINVLTFSNNWWPQVAAEKILENRILRFSSFAIIMGAFAAFLLGYGKIGPREKTLALLSLLFVLGFIFIAQGTNNGLLKAFFDTLDDGQLQFVALFRESGRIALMIPVFLVLAVLASANGLGERRRRLFFSAMLFLVLLHVLSSPIFEYVGTIYSATEVPEEYHALDTEISKEYKTIWLKPPAAPKILSSYRYAWNKEKAFGSMTGGMGSTYSNCSVISMVAGGNASRELFHALNIKYLVERTDIWGASGFDINYSWFECRKLEYLTVCENKDETEPFLIYPPDANITPGSLNETPAGPAVVNGFSRINPTLWYVNVSASGPFLLSFAEVYNPLWEARVYVGGEKKETVQPIKLFETSNGYLINTTGDMEVELRYAPQDMFEAAMTVPLITLLLCISYLGYSIVGRDVR